MTLANLAPLITFAMVGMIGAALRPTPLQRDVTTASRGPVVTPPSASSSGAPSGSSFAASSLVRSLAGRRQPVVDAMTAATWCDELARALRSGATLTAALRAGTGPVGVQTVVESICSSLDRGQSLAEALRPNVPDSPHLGVVLTVLRACAQHGGAAAEPLDRAAATLRARAADHADRLTQSAQARMSAVVMTCLPVGMLALMMLTSASVRGAVLSSVGLLAVGVGAVLNACGWMWMRHIIDRDAS